jgi:DNA-3-methyladenine glycosylase II
MMHILNKHTLAHGLNVITARDSDMENILKEVGPPPLWRREPGFPTLVHIILEQQVSLASAKATFDRLLEHVSVLAPEQFLELDNATLKSIGVSRQKIAYCRNLARAISAGLLDLNELGSQDERSIRSELLKIKGIGHWTINIYLLMALGRVDIWPSGDLALAVSIQHVKKLKSRPSQSEVSIIGEAWRPWRSVATFLLWHYYLTRNQENTTWNGDSHQ